MSKFFWLFFSKTLFLVYSATFFLTFLLGCINVYSINQQSFEVSTAFFIFSLLVYFLLFFVLESNRIYQIFRSADFRLLPISTVKLYTYNLIFSTITGISFFMGNVIIGWIINYLVINIPYTIDMTWIQGLAAAIDIIVLFLLVQLLVCIYASIKTYFQKKFRWVLEIVLFIIFTVLIDYLSVLDLGIVKGFVMNNLGLKQEIYFRWIIQLMIASIYFSLSIWLIDRYVEAED